jgi:hypothetical protein
LSATSRPPGGSMKKECTNTSRIAPLSFKCASSLESHPRIHSRQLCLPFSPTSIPQASHQNRWMENGLPETIPSYGALTEAPGVFEHPISGAVHNLQSPAYGTATAGWPSSFGDAAPQAQYAAIAYPPGYPNMLPETQHSTAASTGGSVPATNPVGGQQGGQPVANAAAGAAGSHNGEYLCLLSDDDGDWDLSDAHQK